MDIRTTYHGPPELKERYYELRDRRNVTMAELAVLDRQLMEAAIEVDKYTRHQLWVTPEQREQFRRGEAV